MHASCSKYKIQYLIFKTNDCVTARDTEGVPDRPATNEGWPATTELANWNWLGLVILLVFDLCDNSMREKDWRCRMRGMQAA
jgi:hypothetical protein